MKPRRITVDIEVTLELDVDILDPGRPANLNGHPDGWSPADPVDLDVAAMHLLVGGRKYNLPCLAGDFGQSDAVYEAVADALRYEREEGQE
jgi:hypothetical protein